MRGTLVYLKDVVTLRYESSRCVGCGMCSIVCPHGVFVQENGKARITDRDACMECDACARNWPTEAIGVQAAILLT